MSEFDAEDFNLEDILSRVNSLQAEQNEVKVALATLDAQYREADALIRRINRERLDARKQVDITSQAIRNAENELARAQRFSAAKAKRDELKINFDEKSKELDSLTYSAQWREFAFDHQITGGKRLAIARRGILADKRGLGKTLTSLIYLDMVQAKRVLIIAPNDIVPQFEGEIQTWAPGRTIFSLRGKTPTERSIIYPMLNMVKEFIITLNYEAWRKDKTIIDDLVAAGIDTIVCDEAHKIKSSTKVTARGVFQLAYRPNYCANCGTSGNFMGPWMQANGTLKDYNYVNGASALTRCTSCSEFLTSTVKNVLTMTGTPILNKPQELFSLLHLVDCNRFETERLFLRDYCYSYAPNRFKFLTGGLDRLTKSMSEFFVQRTREDAGIHIPPPKVTVYELEKDYVKYAKQYAAERTLQNNAALMLGDGETVFSMLYILEIILRERQIMTWPAGVELKLKDEEGNPTGEVLNFDVQESQKLDAACELLGELIEEEQRVIVFSKFKAPLYEMRNRFADEPMVVATGDQSSSIRDAVKLDFDLKTAPKEPRWKVAFATYDAFATGLNLNAARHIIMLDDEWSPGMEDQAIGRIDRLNSTDQANVHIFRVKKSIDDFMAGLIAEKRSLTDGFESEFSTKDFLDHLRG